MSKYVGFRLGKVHESRVISEYYCGGCGWPVTDHDSFCPECGGAFRECDASNLEAENARLREELESVGTAAYLYGRSDLKAENTKADKLCDGYLYYTSYWCRGCDERFAYRPIGGKDRGASPKFCPNCGARIEVDE